MGNNVMLQAFEWNLENNGKLYVQLKQEAKQLKENGFDALWLPPMFKGTGQNDVGYGVYDLYDLGEFDQKGTIRTKYGTLKELKELIDELHKYEIKVYADIVLNHKAGADYSEEFAAIQVDEEDRMKEILMFIILRDGQVLIFLAEIKNILLLSGIFSIFRVSILIKKQEQKESLKLLEKIKS